MRNAGNQPAQCLSVATQPALIDGFHCVLPIKTDTSKTKQTTKPIVGWVEQRETHQPNQTKPKHPSPAKLICIWQMGIKK